VVKRTALKLSLKKFENTRIIKIKKLKVDNISFFFLKNLFEKYTKLPNKNSQNLKIGE
tara:strand:+ start:338 stop:511 length:174 start_codon:yes stop_codon:yes gene_type:complete